MFEKLKRKFVLFLLRRDFVVATSKQLMNEAKKEKARYTELIDRQPDIYALTRRNLKGIEPKLLDSEASIIDLYDTDEELSEEELLRSAKDLQSNLAFKVIMQVTKRDQIQHIARHAMTQEEANFGRATINGIELIQEEVDGLARIYKERNTPEGDYDTSEVL